MWAEPVQVCVNRAMEPSQFRPIHRAGEGAMHAGVHASAVEAMPGWSRGPYPGGGERNLLHGFPNPIFRPSNANGVALNANVKPVTLGPVWAASGQRREGSLIGFPQVRNRLEKVCPIL